MNTKLSLARDGIRLLRLLRWAASAFFLAAGMVAAAPVHVVITAPIGAAGAAGLPELLAQWRQQGLVSDVWAIDSTEGGKAAFGTLAVLEFPNDDCLVRWQQIGASALGAGLVATKADQLARGETFPRDSTKAVFLVAAYDVMAPPEQYRLYAEGYVAPEMESLRTRRNLISYFLFAAQDRASAPWHSVLIMEYREPVAYAERDSEMAAARTDLGGDAAWRHWSEIKQTIRRERSLTPAKWDLLPPPLLGDLPPYRPEQKLAGTIRVLGSFLKFAVAALEEGFNHYQPDIQFANNFTTSSEGAIGGLCTGVSDLATAGDDAKIPDMMPFFNVYGHMPLEISVATGDYEKRGALWPAAIVVNKANPITAAFAGAIGPHLRCRADRRLGRRQQRDARQPVHRRVCPGQGDRYPDVGPARAYRRVGRQGNPDLRLHRTRVRRLFPAAGDALVDQVQSQLPRIRGAQGGRAGAVRQGGLERSHARRNLPRSLRHRLGRDVPRQVLSRPESPGDRGRRTADRTFPTRRRRSPTTRTRWSATPTFTSIAIPSRPMDPRVREFLRFVLSREGQQIIAHTGFFYPLTADYLKEQLKKLD